jgi:aarF domain-containing kinase
MQLVLIDHGLYISEPEPFRLEYCRLWKAILTFNNKTLREIAESWGVQFPELLASITLLSPYRGTPLKVNEADLTQFDDAYQSQLAIRDKLRNFLRDTERIPLQLVFIGRNMRIVQATNQLLGSPVNRPALMANWASKGSALKQDLTLREYLVGLVDDFKFRLTLGVMTVAFWVNRVRQVVFGSRLGWEDLVQRQLQSVAKANFGIELNEDLIYS